MKRLILIIVTAVMVLLGCAHNAASGSSAFKTVAVSSAGLGTYQLIKSPDEHLHVQLSLSAKGAISYNIRYNENNLVLNSTLGLELKNNTFVAGLTLKNASQGRLVQDNYSLLHGKKRTISYTANERIFRFANERQNEIEIVFRVSNDGVAFKYRLVAKDSALQSFVQELTQFTFPSEARAWLQPVAVAQTGYANTNPSYEEYYQMDIAAQSPPASAAGWAFPALFRVGDSWLAITEAGMNGSFHASRLQASAMAGCYAIGQPMPAEVFTGGGLLAKNSASLETPWRIIAIGSLANLMESTLGTDLADPAIKPMDFAKPGFVAWSWAMLKDDATRYDTQRKFIDYAAQMHWPYVLIDALWDTQIGKKRIAQLAQYAATKDIGIILWYNSSGDWNATPQTPKNILTDRQRRLKEFAWLKQAGIKGLKIDFFAGDGQSIMAYYNELARDASDFNLMLNYHGASLPRGLSRTYPNIMTMEAVKGFEFITFSQQAADAAPSHMAMLPFARNLFDPMDFTPTVFSNIKDIKRHTTNGYELALSVLFLSGWQHIAEIPSGMAAVPEYVKNILSDIPVSWDETRFIDGFPGKYAVIARRKADHWYVAGINAESTSTDLTLNLDFISTTGEIITDGPAKAEFTRHSVQPSQKIQIKVKPFGGFLMKF
ncbi:MAG TPA: glycoside hydrolase family 97 catalytic domain-containing protein [Cellvibrionaceae bacterium]